MAGGITSWLFISSYHGFANTGAKGKFTIYSCAQLLFHVAFPLFSLCPPFSFIFAQMG